MRKYDIKRVLNWLGFMLQCPVCSTKYQVSNIKVLDSYQEEEIPEANLLIHSDCHKCKSSVMFNIDISGHDIFTVIAKTDLTKKDSARMNNLPALMLDDCITIHETIQSFDGDFIKAFRTKIK
ncbi:MAG TPA: hypothetical protein PKD79_00335 [Candidatus Doudnabacteria bacterium]|nr:hypothetical protein [Candidatus Doudnabacteria bacterium]